MWGDLAAAGFQHCCGHTLPSQTTPAVACCKHHKPWLFPRSRLGRVTKKKTGWAHKNDQKSTAAVQPAFFQFGLFERIALNVLGFVQSLHGYWGGRSQRDRFLHRFSDLILGSSRIASFLGRQQVAPLFLGTSITTPARVVDVNSSLNCTSYGERKKPCAAHNTLYFLRPSRSPFNIATGGRTASCCAWRRRISVKRSIGC